MGSLKDCCVQRLPPVSSMLLLVIGIELPTEMEKPFHPHVKVIEVLLCLANIRLTRSQAKIHTFA